MLQYWPMAQSDDSGMQTGDEWVFGYGSLIFRVDFPYVERHPAWIDGWERRFWQGSHDHRGTPDAPGRVLTLAPAQGARCGGVVYRVEHSVLQALDYREKNGYERFRLPIVLKNGEIKSGMTYLAPPENPAFLGPAPDETIARQMARSSGPSGNNVDYVIDLARALRAMGERDEHVFALAGLLTGTPAAHT